jgi:acyl-CoA thioesterase
MKTPSEIFLGMMEKDRFSQWLGIECLEIGEGFCTLKMKVRPEMCNGFSIAHGGISFSLADSALAFASNSRGRHALSIHTSISHFKPVFAGDEIIAKAKEISVSGSLGRYDVEVFSNGQLIAMFNGTVFRKKDEW